MKTLRFLLLSSALVASSTSAASKWKTRSDELEKQPNVAIPEGSYTIKCNDKERSQYYIATKDKIWRTLGIAYFIPFGWIGAIPFYYIFAKGLMELSPDPRYAVEFIVQNSENDQYENGFQLQVAEKAKTHGGEQSHGGKYVSEKKLKKESKASLIIAKAAPSYDANETQNINVHLRMISTKRTRWFRAGRRRFISSRRKLRMAHHKFSEWTMILKKSVAEIEQELETQAETEDQVWADESNDE